MQLTDAQAQFLAQAGGIYLAIVADPAATAIQLLQARDYIGFILRDAVAAGFTVDQIADATGLDLLTVHCAVN